MGTEVAAVQVKTIYQTMYARMGKQPWLEEWQETPWEVVYGGILVQNTSWRNVVPSLNNLKLNFNFNPKLILELSDEELQQNVRPSGFYTRKAATIKNILQWAKGYDFSVSRIQNLTSSQLRAELLALHGIGPETADYVMMYAFEHAGFIADKYSRRLFERMGCPLPKGYEAAKKMVEAELDLSPEQWKNFHAMIVNDGKESGKTRIVSED
ncbi:DNA-3-methyladenine glycosylase [Pediococcus acidilactici]|uniref:DNA-3-methyladenine glycosylase n=1 Tax=Pediococcus acidilactici TaxID=1254 RepID=A0AAW8YKV2_PEDAC|nr:DNA-3-methyladenine glycosylase [Pediococcus acidilactici]MDV2910444.1 DNA-3-methyladenine glycosylase [Pediococcus acidilactici]WQS16689.1 DNA-3-methyladenine glycosylase [Pediococcus acidilactici]